MSADHGSAPDLDLLADYTAGVLAGTPEGAAVAARIAADPDWAELHAALVRADEAVRVDLTTLPAAPIPADVAARLDAALRAEPAATKLGATADDGAADSGDADAGNVVPLRRRKSWQVAGGAVAAGVALLTAGAIGMQLFPLSQESSTRDTAVPASAPQPSSEFQGGTPEGPVKSAPGGGLPDADAAPGISASGTAYRRETLAAQVNALMNNRLNAATDSAQSKAQAPKPVQRLATPADLERCLAALGANSRPLAVDFAQFDGAPAVVIVLPAQATGAIDVAVVGPACGQAGADLRLRSDVTR